MSFELINEYKLLCKRKKEIEYEFKEFDAINSIEDDKLKLKILKYIPNDLSEKQKNCIISNCIYNKLLNKNCKIIKSDKNNKYIIINKEELHYYYYYRNFELDFKINWNNNNIHIFINDVRSMKRELIEIFDDEFWNKYDKNNENDKLAYSCIITILNN